MFHNTHVIHNKFVKVKTIFCATSTYFVCIVYLKGNAKHVVVVVESVNNTL